MNTSSPIQVMIVDDHESLRRSVALALATFGDFQVVAEASNGLEAIELYPKIRPDVIIMDLQMPKMDGVTTIARLRPQYPETRIMAFASYKDEHLVTAALAAGADAYLFKDVSMDKLAAKIQAVALGRRQPLDITG